MTKAFSPEDVPDRIHKEVVLAAPLTRVWRAISDARELGAWFGCELDGDFVAGQQMTGRIRPTEADPEVAKLQEPHTGKPFTIWVERIEPERVFAFRWHPFAIEPGVDYSAEPTTLVEFTIEAVPGGTKLTITESGFSRIPLARRAAAFTANDGGWSHQATLVAKYLALRARDAT